MSADLEFAATAAEALLDALVALISAGSGPGTAKIFDGVTLLATITLADPIGSTSGGTLTVTATSAASVVADGTADSFLVEDSDGNDVYAGEATLTAGGGALTLDSVTLVTGGTCSITGGTITLPTV